MNQCDLEFITDGFHNRFVNAMLDFTDRTFSGCEYRRGDYLTVRLYREPVR
ncbi:MAG TPA: hypothetical protein VHV54_26265 [Candidatus Binatia bacterium]|nr:hypothetical protein [Candidatus Binatia bacterium]